jgi:hypothetical protein
MSKKMIPNHKPHKSRYHSSTRLQNTAASPNIKDPHLFQYFDELRALLPFGSDSAKFDKNAILHHSIVLLKNLMAELAQEVR